MVGAVPGVLLGDQVVDHDSEGKRVTLSRVHVPLQSLRRHVEGTPHRHVLNSEGSRLWNPLCEAKISNLPDALPEEDIGGLQVAMDDVMLGEVFATLGHLVDDSTPLDVFFLIEVLF